jgi:hypothetical protein
MKYPKEFIEKCKQIYPDFDKLHNALDNGHEIVGRYLCDSCSNGISFEFVLSVESLETLKQIAANGKARDDIYLKWTKIFKGGMI